MPSRLNIIIAAANFAANDPTPDAVLQKGMTHDGVVSSVLFCTRRHANALVPLLVASGNFFFEKTVLTLFSRVDAFRFVNKLSLFDDPSKNAAEGLHWSEEEIFQVLKRVDLLQELSFHNVGALTDAIFPFVSQRCPALRDFRIETTHLRREKTNVTVPAMIEHYISLDDKDELKVKFLERVAHAFWNRYCYTDSPDAESVTAADIKCAADLRRELLRLLRARGLNPRLYAHAFVAAASCGLKVEPELVDLLPPASWAEDVAVEAVEFGIHHDPVVASKAFELLAVIIAHRAPEIAAVVNENKSIVDAIVDATATGGTVRKPMTTEAIYCSQSLCEKSLLTKAQTALLFRRAVAITSDAAAASSLRSNVLYFCDSLVGKVTELAEPEWLLLPEARAAARALCEFAVEAVLEHRAENSALYPSCCKDSDDGQQQQQQQHPLWRHEFVRSCNSLLSHMTPPVLIAAFAEGDDGLRLRNRWRQVVEGTVAATRRIDEEKDLREKEKKEAAELLKAAQQKTDVAEDGKDKNDEDEEDDDPFAEKEREPWDADVFYTKQSCETAGLLTYFFADSESELKLSASEVEDWRKWRAEILDQGPVKSWFNV